MAFLVFLAASAGARIISADLLVHLDRLLLGLFALLGSSLWGTLWSVRGRFHSSSFLMDHSEIAGFMATLWFDFRQFS